MKENIIIATPEFISAISKMAQDIQEIKEQLKGSHEEAGYVSGEEARKLLGISHSTWQTWRDQKRIPFCQVGRKIWVKREDINDYLCKHEIKKQ